MKFTRENAAKYGAIGGSKTSERKKIIVKINRRQKCSSKCPFFDKCPVMPLSFASEDKACKLKQLPQAVKIKYYNLFLAGEEGLLQEIREIVWRIKLKVEKEGDVKELERVARLLMEFYKMLYGERRKIDFEQPIKLKLVVEEVESNES